MNSDSSSNQFAANLGGQFAAGSDAFGMFGGAAAAAAAAAAGGGSDFAPGTTLKTAPLKVYKLIYVYNFLYPDEITHAT